MARGLTIRSRLTLLTAGLVLVAGSVLILGSYWWLTNPLPTAAAQSTADGVAVSVDGRTVVTLPGAEGVLGRTIASTGAAAPLPDPSGATFAGVVSDAVASASEQLAQEVARRAALQAAAALVLLTLMALGIGWFAARRALAPVHAMTESARQLAEWPPTDRIIVDGPQDEVRELGETFNGLLDRVETAVRGEKRLIANTSHELRTPLANQRAVLELALETAGADRASALESGARTALDQNQRMHRLIDQLLLIARVEQGEPTEQDVVPLDLVTTTVGLVRSPGLLDLAGERVQVAVEAGDESVMVLGDAVLVERMIGNLVENAVRYNVEGGTVSVRVAVVAGHPCVTVANTGPVVAQDDLDALVQPFRRGPSSGPERVRSHAATGLGLSIVEAIARRYDVRLELEPLAAGGLAATLHWPEAGGTLPSEVGRAVVLHPGA